MKIENTDKIQDYLHRIAKALEILTQTAEIPATDLLDTDKYIWDAKLKRLSPVWHNANIPSLDLLVGIDHQLQALYRNTEQFANGFPANNALLWGARGMGKSTAIKAVFEDIIKKVTPNLIIIEIARDDLSDLPLLLEFLWQQKDKRFLIFCDDLSFENEDTSYKSLKAVLEDELSGRPPHVLFYATSNRRNLVSTGSRENLDRLESSETRQEQISLSDRFGLWIGFHPCSQDQYLDIIQRYVEFYNLPVDQSEIRQEALIWEKTRGSRSGRVAWQFIQDLAGRLNSKLENTSE